ncbi:DNA internalization-related competence protein ComEC/Rec2 [Paenibacillus sp. CC-CFT747]|nr:DNA internalization-related competence protein ComEC/Rec2 [Paenibacillus sp. CC-CFT747]
MKPTVVSGAWVWTAGYTAAIWLPGLPLPLPVVLGAAALTAALHLLALPGRRPALFALLFLMAAAYYQWSDGRLVTRLELPAGEAGPAEEGSAVMRGTLVSPVTVDGDKASFLLLAEEVHGEDGASLSEESRLDGKEKLQVSVKLLKPEEQAAALALRRGDRIELEGTIKAPEGARNFGGFDYRRYLRLQGIHWLVSAKGTEQLHRLPAQPLSWPVLLSWNDRLRDHLGTRLDAIFPAEQAGYMKGLLVGLRSDLDPESFQQFSQLGLTHILAISGLHVAVFVAVLLWMLARTRVTRETSLLIVLSLLPFYILLTGASPSVIRAGGMAMIALYAARKGWLKDGLHLVCLVGWLMLLWKPYYLLDVGFQLSFLVTIGLILGVAPFSRLLPAAGPTVTGTLAVTFVAQAASFPLSVYYFNQFSLISWFANLLLVPLISFVVTPAGSAALLIGLISERLGQLLAWPTVWINRFSFRIVEGLDSWSSFHLIWPSPSEAWVAAYYGLGGLMLIGVAARRKALTPPAGEGVHLAVKMPWYGHKGILAAAVVLFALLMIYGYSPDKWNREATVNFIDVGQGDAIWIHTPGDRNLLVDGGGTVSFRKAGEDWKNRQDSYEVGRKLLVPLLKKRGIHKLDALIITHGDQDHIGGLQAVLEQIPVKRIFFNGTVKNNATLRKLLQTAQDRGIPLFAAGEGTRFDPDGETSLVFLYPLSEGETKIREEEHQNDSSLVFLMDMYQKRFLFSGDMEKEGEAELLTRLDAAGIRPESLQPIDVLKIAHHGSKTSSTPEWLEFWKPAQTVISVGKTNTYGHPSPRWSNGLSPREPPFTGPTGRAKSG